LVEAESFPRAEEAVRLLAAAAGAARLYPPASALPREAAERFVARSSELTGAGPLRYVIDPHSIRIGDAELASTQGQVTSLAEALHALQVGQLVIAPGVSVPETEAFVALANSDPAQVRSRGGARTELARMGVRHIAVIEVSLRSSDESGLLGVDLTTAPLDDIAEQVAAATERRAREAAAGVAHDEMAEAIDRLEEATRELAMERVAHALMRLPEETRNRVLGIALAADANGGRMEGMLAVIARMKPAALARLLTLVAAQSQTDPRRVSSALQLPPETAKALELLLTPTPDLSPEFELPDTQVAATIAAEVTDPCDPLVIQQQVKAASPSLSAGRALATATAVSRSHADADTVCAIGEVLPLAAREGSFSTVREALRRLDEISADPAFGEAVTAARATLAMPEVLRDVCRAAQTDADAAIAGEILHAAGVTGAEALLDTYIRLPQDQRSLLQPVLRGSSELVLGVARSRLRSAPAPEAVAIVRALAVLGDRRAAAVIAGTLEGSLEEQVRFAAATALASMPAPEATQALTRALGHREVETQRYIVRELGRVKAAPAVPALVRTFDDVNVLAKSYEIRKEIITALASIDTPEARKALRRFSGRPGFGRKSRELKRLASDAIVVAVPQGVDAP
jgi:hypothetical protein